ncbi:MAG: TetR/AcrR family transcriptional regulator [Propionibacteriaceae bacterium]
MRPDSTRPRSGSFIEAARRAQIIDAAITAVNEVGYHKASLALIAERAQTSKSVISYHFDGKEEVLLKVTEHVFGQLGELIMAAVAEVEGPTEQLTAYVRTYFTFMRDHRSAMLAALEIMVSHRDADGVPLYQVEGEDDTALLEAILTAGMADGSFREVDLRVATTTIVHALDGGLSRSQIHSDVDLVDYGEHLRDLLLGMLGAHPDD